MRYAVVQNGIVDNVIVMTDPSQWVGPESCIALNDGERVSIGCTYDPNANPRFIPPPAAPVRQSWTAYQFLLRFTAAERAAFRASALTDPNVADFQQLAQAAQEVLSDDPMTVAGMDYLVSVGLLTEQRKQEILS